MVDGGPAQAILRSARQQVRSGSPVWRALQARGWSGDDPTPCAGSALPRPPPPRQVYETLNDDSQAYIKLYNLQTKVMCNRAYGRLTKAILPFLLSIHIAPRPIWLCRSGLPDSEDREEDHNPSAECKVPPSHASRPPIF